MSGSRAAADFDLAPAGLAADGQKGAFGEDFDPAGAVFGLAGAAIEPDDFGAAQAAGEADRQNRPVAQAPQVHLQRRQHGQKLVGEDRGFLEGRAGVAAADAGEHGGDMAVADLERLAELPVAPGDAGQPPLEGRDRKLGPAALDLRREVEADRFRIGRRLRETLAAQPRGELPPVGGVGALGVVGLRRAGVGLGGLRQRRQAAAEAPGGREQGRGVRAGSLGLRRRAFRLSALRAVPDASVRTALRVGWRVAVGRAGAAVGADRAGRAGALGAAASAPPAGSGGLRLGPGACGASRSDAPEAPCASSGMAFQSIGWRSRAGALKADQPAVEAAGRRMGGAGEGAPAAADPDASLADASARFPGSGKERRFGSDGPGASGAADRRPAPSGASRAGEPSLKLAARTTFSDASAASEATARASSGRSEGPMGPNFRPFPIVCEPRSESCPIKEAYRTSSPTTSGADSCRIWMTKRREGLTMAK